ncbi:MAG: phosphodiester glycosidase family protein [Clostridia bacterium]|nr:phosphodiester glycosidase family protein [Clostridia bacterium]
MKRSIRSTAAALALGMGLTAMPIPSLAADLEYERTYELSHGLTMEYSKTLTASGIKGQSYIYEYEPGEKTGVIVAYGDELYGKSNVNKVVNYVEKQGYTVMAAVNGDFFSVSSGIPTGLVVREGRLISSDGAWNAVGFYEDGTAIVGTPKLDITFSVNGGQRFPIAGFNKVRDGKGAFLYSGDYGPSTYLSAEGPVVIMKKTDSDDQMTIGASMVLEVVEAGVSKGASRLDDDTFVLTHQKAVSLGIDLTTLQTGDLVTIYTGTRSEGWEDVYYACGGGDLLVQNGSLTSAGAASSARGPRTMLGIDKRGKVSILVCDGRSGSSGGMTLSEGAKELVDRGCETVINLDGGGSSIASARYPGYENSNVVSEPSDGTPRDCATYIVFVNEGSDNGREYGVSVYPKDALVLAGGSIGLEAKSYNKDYFPIESYQSGFTIEEGGGYIEGNVLTLPEYGCEVVVTNNAVGRCDEAVITAVDEPKTLEVVKKGSQSALKSISLEGGDSVDLDVVVTDGLRTIISTDDQFEFEVSGNIGEITSDGRFMAADVQGMSGSVTVSYGDMSKTVKVTVGKAPEVVCGFEKPMTFTPSAIETAEASASVSLIPDNARYGMGSLSLKAKTGEEASGVSFVSDKKITLTSGMKQLTFTAKGSGSWNIDFRTSSDIVSRSFECGAGWTFNTVSVPSGATAVEGFSILLAEGTEAEVYIDQLIGHFGSARADNTSPKINELYTDGDVVLQITDNGIYSLESENVTVRLDGESYSGFAFDGISGVLQITMPEDGLMHKLTVEVSDYFGNLSRYSITAGEKPSGPFGDISGHWAEKEIHYLHNEGVFTADATFRPQSSATNEMIATMISRYMGIDTSKYENVVLPYADLDKVHDWALPHLKALYSLGIMQGGSDASGNIWFYPLDAANRGRVMTVLGRTIERGYSYETASYSDFASVPSWAKDHISLLSHLGIVNGYGGGNEVKANAGISRAEIAALLYRLY